MNKNALIRTSGNLLDLSVEGYEVLPHEIKVELEAQLSYTFQKQLFGFNRYDSVTGLQRTMQFEDRRLYRYDEQNRFCCGAGFLSRVQKILKELGYVIKLSTQQPDHIDSSRFKMDWDSVFSLFKFRARQEDCLLTLASHECGAVEAPTGFGKMILIAALCVLFNKAKIHVVTARRDIVASIMQLLVQYIPNVGMVGSGKNKLGDRVTIFTADSLHKSDGFADILILDEAHQAMSHSRAIELAKYKYSRNYAFSATPEGRMDGTDKRLESLFGEIIFKLSYQEAVELGLVVPIVVDWINIDLPTNPCANKEGVVKKRWGLWRNDERNRLIAEKAKTFTNGEQVLILTETVEHAVRLKALLPEYKLCYATMTAEDLKAYKRCGYLDDDEEILTPKARDALRKSFETGETKLVIATDVWSTGVNFKNLQVLIRADGRASFIIDVQSAGRASRIDGEKAVGTVVDCIDSFDNGLLLKSTTRKKHYAKKGWENLNFGNKPRKRA